MTNEKLYEVLGDINEKQVKEAREYRKAKKPVWLKWGVMAACLCLVVVGAFMATNINRETPNYEDLFVEAAGFQMNGSVYRPITFEQRKEFKIVPAEDIGLSEENKYIITKEDLGEQIGVVEECPNKALIGLPVYYFALWAEDERICIVDANGTYAFYVRD